MGVDPSEPFTGAGLRCSDPKDVLLEEARATNTDQATGSACLSAERLG